MSKMLKWMLPFSAAVALVLGLSVISAHAQDAAADPGSVEGTVVDRDGKTPVADATVTLTRPMARRGAGGASVQTPQPQPLAGAGAGGGAGAGRGRGAVATATTDKEGKFKMDKVPPGDYVIRVMVRDRGFAQQNIKVESKKTTTVKLQLGDMPARGRRGGE
jgi:hypothetical protein